MAFPTVRARTETVLANGTALAIDFVQNTGDLVVVWLGLNDTAQALSSNDLGFTDVTNANVTFHVLAKVLDGSEAGVLTVTVGSNTKGAAIAFNITAGTFNGTTAYYLATVATGTSVNPDSNTLSPTPGSKDYLWITAFRQNGEEANDDTWVTGTPTNYGNLTQVTSGTGGLPATNGSVASADRTATTATEDPGAFTTAQSLAWRAYTMAIAPSSVTNYPVTAGDSLASISESTGRTVGWIRSSADTLSSLVDSIASRLGAVRTGTDELASLAEAAVGQVTGGGPHDYYATVDDAVASVGDSVARLAALVRREGRPGD